MRTNHSATLVPTLPLNQSLTREAVLPLAWRAVIVMVGAALAVSATSAAQGPQAQADWRTQGQHPDLSFVPQTRITAPIDTNDTVVTPHSVLNKIKSAKDLGALPDSTPMTGMKLVFRRSVEQEIALQQLLAEQQDPSSPNFHKWVTPEEFGVHFGPAQSDIDAISSWLESQGFTVVGVPKGRQTLEFAGTAAQVNAAFKTELRRFEINGEARTSNATEVQIPAALASVVVGIARLDNIPAHTMIRLSGAQFLSPPAPSPSNGPLPQIFNGSELYYSITPSDFWKIYNEPSNWNGNGITIGLPESSSPDATLTNLGNGVYGNSNYDNFNSVFGLPDGKLSIEFPFGQPPANNGGAASEADLDSQWAHAVAPGAKILMIPASDLPDGGGVYVGIDRAQDYMVDQNLVDIISLSYGSDLDGGGASSYTAYQESRGEQAAAQGISMMAGSGDWGSSGYGFAETQLDESQYADHPYVTSVGGTSIDPGSNGLYWMGLNTLDYTSSTVRGHVPEDGWSGSGGGSSAIYSKPAWQAGVRGIPNDGARDFPDVSFNANELIGYLTCLAGACAVTKAPIVEPVGGTSASSPILAGVTALLDQKYGGRQGLLNPTLYKLGAEENWGNCNGSSQAESEPPSSCVFYDETAGSNAVLGQSGYGSGSATYNAVEGYDRVTGLGSINIAQFLSQWGSVSYLPTDVSLTLASTAFYGSKVSFSGTVSDPSNAGIPTGYVDILSSGHSWGPFALDGNGNFSGAVQGLSLGNDSVVAVYGGDTNYAKSQSSAQTIAITKVTSTLSAALSPAVSSAAYGANSYQLTVTATGASGYGNPTGQVHVYYTPSSTGVQHDSGLYTLSATPGSTTGSQAVISSFFPNTTTPDTYTIAVTYAGDSTFNSSSANPATSLIITKASSSTSLATSTNAATNGTSVTLTSNILTTQGATTPGGTVQFYSNGTAVGSPVALTNISLSGSVYSASAALNTTALRPGTDVVTVVYSGDVGNASSTSGTQTVSIAGYTDTVSIATNLSGFDYLGANLTLTATVFSQLSTPAISGSVQFFGNGVSLGSANLTSGSTGGKQVATASLQTTALPAGTDTLYAVYSGDANYDPQTSFTISVPVTQTVPNGFTTQASLNFGDVTLNTVAPTQQVDLGNSGTANLVFGSASITGPNAASFSVAASTCSSGAQLAPLAGRYCVFTIGFTPTQSGALSASLVITDNGPSSPHTILLTGTGVPAGAYAQLSTTVINFVAQTVNTTSSAQTLTLTNIGNQSMTSLSFSGANAPFAADTSACPGTLAPQASCTISITFSPTSTGPASATLLITQTSTAAGQVQTPVSLSGSGYSAAGASLLGVVHTLPGNFSSPSGVVADSHGNFYVSDTANNAVYKIDPTGNQTTLPIVGLTSPGAMTMDANGYLYVISNGGFNNVNVIKFKSATDQVAIPYTNVPQATGVAVDTNGNIYIADPSASSVWQSAPLQSAATQIGFAKLGLLEVNAIAIDSNNNMYVTGTNGTVNELNKIPGITGTYTTIASGLTNPLALAIGPGNTVYLADGTTNQVHLYAGGNSLLILDSPAITGVSNIFVDTNYNLFLASAGQVFESSNQARANAGFATIGTPGSVWVTMNVPAGNSIVTINATDLAGDSEWTLPTGNSCAVTSNVCSFQVKFSPVYPGMRAGTVTVKDAVSSTHIVDFYGVGQGPQATFLTGNKTMIAGTWIPSALVSDSAGNVYVLDQTNSSAPIIQKITPSGAVSTAIDPTSAGGGSDSSFAVDGQGNIYMEPVNEGPGIFEYESGGYYNEPSQGSGQAGPFALDNAGDFYSGGGNQVAVTDSHYNTLATYTYGSSSPVTVTNVAVDSLKNIYVTTSEPAVYMTSWAGVTTKLLDTTTSPGGFTLSNPTGIAVDAAGTLYVADAGANALFRIDSQDNASAFGLNLTNPSVVGVTITPQAALYIADQANAAVYRFDPANATFSFGNVNDQNSSPVQSVQLANTGNMPLNLSAVTAPAAYVQQQDSGWCTSSSSLSNGGVCDLTYLFDPSTLGSLSGSITVSDNSLNAAATQNIALSGHSVIGRDAKLAWITAPPASLNADANLGKFVVQVQDAAGNGETTSGELLQLLISGPQFSSGTVFSSGTTSNGQVTFDLSATSISQAGTYTLTVVLPANSNITTLTATLVVNPLSQTITFGPLANQTYGVAAIPLNASASSGLSVSYAIIGPANLSGNTIQVIGAGQVTVTAQQAGNATYSAAASVQQTFTVSPALLTVTPNNTNKYVNQINPALTYSITGYVNGDAVEFPVVSGTPVLSTTATTTSSVGAFPITAAQGTLAAANYIFQFGTGTLTVVQPSSPVTPPISWYIPASITYGDLLTATQLNATTITGGQFIYSPVAGTILGGGTQTLNVTFYPTDTTNYTTATASVQILVNPATPTVLVSSSANPAIAGSTVTFSATVTGITGDAQPTGTVSFVVNSAVNGQAQLGTVTLNNGVATLPTGSLLAGQQPYTISVVYNGDSNYASTPSGNLAQTIVPSANVGGSITFQISVLDSTGAGQIAGIQVGAQGSWGREFSLQPGGTCTVGRSLAAGSNCTANISFAPTRPGVSYGAINLTDASGNIIASNDIAGIGVGPQVNFLGGPLSVVGSGLSEPDGLATDWAGNVYVADTLNNRVVMAPANGGAEVVVDTNLSFPYGVAVDGAGNVYVADTYNNRVVMDTLTAGGYVQSVIPSSALSQPFSVAVDSNGDVFVADTYNNRILEEANSQYTSANPWTESVISTSALTNPSGVAVDAGGNLYIADTGNNRVLLEAPTSSGYNESNVTNSTLAQPMAVAVDAIGNVYIPDTFNSQVLKEVPTAGGFNETVLPIGNASSPVVRPLEIAVDGSGNFYIINVADWSVRKVDNVDPPSVNFPTGTAVNSIDNTDGAMTVSVQNIGNAPLTFTAPVSGTNPSYPANFIANTADTNLCTSATPLAAGASCDVSIDFLPATAGANTGSVVLTDNALNVANTTQNIQLSGTGIGLTTQTITFTPPTSPVIFGTAPITLVATGGASGNPVTFSIVSGPGSLSGANNSILTLTGGGTIVVAANQAGNANYAAAPQVTRSIVVEQPATLATPTAGHAFAGSNVTFTWTAATGATGYLLSLGSTGAGSSNLYYSGSTTATSVTATGLPTNGETIYARLFTNFNGSWAHVDYTFTAVAQAALTTPTPGGTLTGSRITFDWTTVTGATGYILSLGSTGVGSSNLYYSNSITTASVIVTGLPTNGETIYARLLTDLNGTWVHADYTYKAAPPTGAALTAPAPGSTLINSSVKFTWNAASGATGYLLELGSTGVGSYNLYYSGSTTATTVTATDLPTNGETIYARLLTNNGGTWLHNDYTYTAVTQSALSAPTPGSTLTSSSTTFSWTSVTGSTGYLLSLGSTGAGSTNLYYSGSLITTSTTVKGLPINGETIYARLFTNNGGAWLHTDYTYKAVTEQQAVLTTPTPSSTLAGSSVTFTWASAPSATGYILSLGSSGVGSTNLYYSGSTTATSVNVTALPINGEPIYARLFTQLNGTWVHTDYTYTAATEAQAVLTTPTPSSTLTGSAVTFTWTSAPSATGYMLALGSTGAGSTNLYYSGSTTATSVTVTKLPTNGETIYARLFTQLNGTWVHTDYTYAAQ